MAKSFKVSIVTPEKTAFEAEAVSIVLPGSEGYLGIWANHAPLVTGIAPGVIMIREDDTGASAKVRYMSVSNGFLEVADNVVTILCDACEQADAIDIERAKAALERAKQRLRSSEAEVDKERAREAVERAAARIHAAYLREGHRE
jgi:F-type H+-transporting ATPase subunit epsilon